MYGSRLLYPMSEAASRLGVGRTTLYEIAKRGELEVVHIGRKSLIPSDSLNAYVERLTANAKVGALQ